MAEKKSGRSLEYTAYLLLLLSPFVHLGFLYDYADLPKAAFVQCISFLLLTCALFRRKISFTMDPSTLFILLLLLWGLGSIFNATSLYEGFTTWIQLSAAAAFHLLLIGRKGGERWIPGLLSAMYLAMFGTALIGCAQHLFQLDWIPQSVPPAATFANRNMAAQFVSMILPTAFPLFFLFPKRRYRIFFISAAFIAVLYLFFAGSRAAWLSCSPAFLFIARGVLREYRFPPSLFSRSPGVAVILFLIAVSPLNPVRSTWFQKIGEAATPLFIH